MHDPRGPTTGMNDRKPIVTLVGELFFIWLCAVDTVALDAEEEAMMPDTSMMKATFICVL